MEIMKPIGKTITLINFFLSFKIKKDNNRVFNEGAFYRGIVSLCATSLLEINMMFNDGCGIVL